MPTTITKHFGPIEYEERAVIRFPRGLPAFEDQERFILVEQPATAPVVFLQSLARADLRFVTLPTHVIDPDYQLAISPEDLKVLGFPIDHDPEAGGKALCLTVIAVAPNGPATANLLAPIVVNLSTRQAVQAIRFDSLYSHEHCLERAPACS